MNLQSNSFSKAFCLSVSLSKSLSLCPLSSTSVANLYFKKYASILYPKELY